MIFLIIGLYVSCGLLTLLLYILIEYSSDKNDPPTDNEAILVFWMWPVTIISFILILPALLKRKIIGDDND